MERLRLQIDVSRDTCPYCKDAVRPGQANVACQACMAWHHTECWNGFDACSACRGKVALRPAVETKQAPVVAKKACGHRVHVCQHSACSEEATSEVYAKLGMHYCQEHALIKLRHKAAVLKACAVVCSLGIPLFALLGTIQLEAILGIAICLPLAVLFWIVKDMQDSLIDDEERASRGRV